MALNLLRSREYRAQPLMVVKRARGLIPAFRMMERSMLMDQAGRAGITGLSLPVPTTDRNTCIILLVTLSAE